MSQYKITYRKSPGSFFSGTTWHCYIYDRKYETEHSGMGKTKKEAKDNAFDSVWSSRNSIPSYSGPEPSTGNEEINAFALTSFGFGGIGLFISVIIFFFKGCGLFHFDPREPGAYLFSFDDATKGFWNLPIGGLIIGVLLAIFFKLRKTHK